MAVFVSTNLEFLIGTLFTEEYFIAIPMINFLLIILYYDLIRVIYTRVVVITENTKIMLFLLLGTVINIIGNIILIPIYGMYGALFATGFSLIISSSLLTYQAHKLVKTNINKGFVVKFLLNILLFYFILLELNKNCDNWFSFLALNIVGALIMFTIFRLNRCFNDNERAFINDFLPRKVFVF